MSQQQDDAARLLEFLNRELEQERAAGAEVCRVLGREIATLSAQTRNLAAEISRLNRERVALLSAMEQQHDGPVHAEPQNQAEAAVLDIAKGGKRRMPPAHQD
jgi:hypothetical protein